MSTATQTVSPEAYLSCTHYEPDAEFVDGVIEECAAGELDHAAWQDAILSWFRLHAREWNIRVYPELRVQVTPSRFRVPDAMILDRNQPLEQIIHACAHCCVRGAVTGELDGARDAKTQRLSGHDDPGDLAGEYRHPGVVSVREVSEIEALVDL